MDPLRRSIAVLLIGVFLTQRAVWTQDPTGAPAPPPPPPLIAGGNAETEDVVVQNFISFEEDVDDMDIFRRNKMEYLMLSDKRTARQAYLTCQEYNAVLAYLEDVNLATFVAVALSETRLEMDTLWVAGKRDINNTGRWLWHKEDREVPVSDDVAAIIVKSEDLKVDADDRDCLGFGRLDHDLPQLRPLACNGKRTVICQRPRGKGGKGNSTHPGWIKIRDRLYKIYADKLPYDAAEMQCPMNDKDATLAVVASYEDAQMLGRYLLIGRPSLENAWIGAKWITSSYVFEGESIELHNVTEGGTHYPPWRNSLMKNGGGCLLLDRHLANITLFVEARCERERALICYKMDTNGTGGINSSDVIIGAFGYRLVYSPTLIWTRARDFCLTRYERWEAKLVEIDSVLQKNNLLYVMGENKTAVQHIWVGGYYNDSKWWWNSNKQEVDRSVLNWVKNGSYEEIAEQNNKCLNMDRENHIEALHYGAECNFNQAFVCLFPADKLRELQAEEQRNRTKRADELV